MHDVRVVKKITFFPHPLLINMKSGSDLSQKGHLKANS